MRNKIIVCILFQKMAGTVKQVSNLTGLFHNPNAKHVLKRIYMRNKLLLEKIPEHAAYRKHTQEIINQRCAIVDSTDDIKAVEEKIGCGLIEELIVQARKELELTEFFLFMKPWESLEAPIPKNQWNWPIK